MFREACPKHAFRGMLSATKKLPQGSCRAMLSPKFIEQCFQDENFARFFRQFAVSYGFVLSTHRFVCSGCHMVQGGLCPGDRPSVSKKTSTGRHQKYGNCTGKRFHDTRCIHESPRECRSSGLARPTKTNKEQGVRWLIATDWEADSTKTIDQGLEAPPRPHISPARRTGS